MKVSVIVPTRDRRALLARALASIEAQQFRDFEVIVVDDGSAEGTPSWLRATHPGVSFIETGQSRGAAAARNRGVERARGEIVAFLDDDDVWRPSYLEQQVAQFEAHPEADLCTTRHIEIDSEGRISHPDLRLLSHYASPLVHFLAECPVHTLSVVACRRAVFERIGRFDETLSIVHDLDWYLRLIAAGGRMEHSSAALVEHSLPGGLVAQHRDWFREERTVHRRLFTASKSARQFQRLVRASRALLFARIGLVKGDFGFGLLRLAEAFLISPLDTVRIAARRLLERRISSAEGWNAGTREAR